MFIEKAIEMEDGPEKSALIETIANHMKKSYLIWNKDTVSNEQIMKDLHDISKGKIKLDAEVKLSEAKDLLAKGKKKNRMGFKR